MAHEVSTSHNVLERMLLDESADPTSLPLSLLEYITNNFSLNHQIGSSGFAIVYKGMVGKGIVAVKKLSNAFLHENKFHEEVICLIKAKHKNIVRFLGYCAKTEGKMENYEGKLVMADQRNWFLCFEYVCNGSLDKHITDASCGLNWRLRYRIIRGICEGLLFLHEKHILHLDLKPAKILLDAHMVPKIACSGLSICLGEEDTRLITDNICGTMGYIDPEYQRSGQMTYASDIHALGFIIMEMLTGMRNYREEENVVQSWMIRLEATEGDMLLNQVRVCYKIGVECMNLDPKKRPIARHIVHRLDKLTDNSDETSIANSLWGVQHMKEITSNNILDTMLLDENAEPRQLPLSLLADITNHFSLDQRVGSGGFAVVYKGIVGRGTVAVKKLSNTFGIHENKFKEEIKCLIHAKHKNIVRFLGYCADTQGKIEEYEGDHVMAEQRNWLLCFEYAHNGSLDQHITDASCVLNWTERYRIIKGICEGLLYLHDNDIIHLDMKPGNILLDGDMVPKITDFGMSRRLCKDKNHAITQNIFGTLGYADPEYLKTGEMTRATDIYSLGVIIMEILIGVRRYPEDWSLIESWMNQLEASHGGMELEQVRVCIKIGLECMGVDPKKRPGAQDIIDMLDKMNHEVSTSHAILERMLFDESAESTSLPLSLLQYITNHFSLDQHIGSGGFSVVYKGVVGNGMVAVKKLSNTSNLHENKFHEEIRCLINAKHKNIVRLLGYCAETQGNMETYEGKLIMEDQRDWLLCFEYACNGSLDKYITDANCGLNWRERYRIIRGICQGLHFLHEMRILHLDLKPSNVLLDGQMAPKIADFGLARCLGEDQTHDITKYIIGTLGYMDPEYLRSGRISFASDIYSLGVIIFEIMTGMKGYPEEENVVEIWMNRLEASERDLQLEQVRVCNKIVIECMNLDPKKRPDARNITDRLDKTTSADYPYEIGTSSSLAQMHASLPRRQSGERFGKLAAKSLHKADVEENYEKMNDSLWGAQDTKQKANQHGVSIFSTISTAFNKLNNLDIFNRKARMGYNRKDMRRILGRLDTIKIFRKDELEPILRSSNLIGKGAFTEAYKGVVDNTQVTVKKPIEGNAIIYDQFADEVRIQSQATHKNIVRLIGCCLEMDTPILVYEFVSKGSLDDILHSDKKVPLSLDVRLTIAAESAQGLYFLHSQAHTKILHGYVLPANILLDDNFIPKISDFGMSRLIAINMRHTGNFIGDVCYMDPAYLQTGLLTEKSDVYSFGIVILEVISRKKATYCDNNRLVRSFLEVHEEGKKATDLFDKEIAVTTGDFEILDSLAEMAVECLNLARDQRPTMTDIAERLLTLQRHHRSQICHRIR